MPPHAQKGGALVVCLWAKHCQGAGGVQVHRCPPVLNLQYTFPFDPSGPQGAAALFPLATSYSSARTIAAMPFTAIME